MKFIFPLTFLALVALFTWLSGPLYRDAIESDLTQKVDRLLEKEGLTDVAFEIDYLKLDLPNQSNDNVAATQVISTATRAWGAYMPDPSGIEVIPADPASFTAKEVDGGLVLTGILPNKELQQKLVAAAEAIPGVASVDDQTEIRTNIANPAWGAAIPGLMGSLIPTADASLITARDGQLTIAGEVDSDDTKAGLVAKAGAIDLKLDDRLKVVEWSQPFVNFERRGRNLEVTGLLPDAKTQKATVAAARAASGLKVKDSTKVEARVRPIWWGDHQKNFAPSFISGSAGDATVRYSADKLYARATAASPAAKARLEKMGASTESRYSPDIQVTMQAAPEPNLVAVRDGKKIVLTGQVGTRKHSQEIETAVRAAMPKTEIVNRLKVAAPRADFPDTGRLAGVFPVLFNTENIQGPRIVADIKSVKIEGTVPSAAEKTRIGTAALSGGSDQRFIKNTLAIQKAAPEKPPELASQLKNLAVYFNTASSYIGSKEVPKIEQAAKVLANSGDAELIVGGYADLRGNAESNRKLSLERAKAVRDRLVVLGVPAERMIIQHFGEDTSKTAKEDLWKSRRVEISISK